MITALPTISVSAIFLLWKVTHRDRQLRERQRRDDLLRQRVAYLLWVAATHGETPPDDDDEERLAALHRSVGRPHVFARRR
jgi:hypothetical protein